MQMELLEPAVKGTLNVLRAAKDCGVGRVVLMSSQAAMVPNPNWPAGKVIDDDSWADVELLKKLQVNCISILAVLLHCCRSYGSGLHACAHLCSELQIWYSVSKTLAEKAAWDFAMLDSLDHLVVDPVGEFFSN